VPPALHLDRVLEQTGYSAWLAGQRDGSVRLAHLGMLRSLLEGAEGGLGAWLAELQLDEELPAGRDDGRRILLTTIHGAKGGEWRVVFVAGVEEGLLPHARSLITNGRGSTSLDEELRVAYVAVTRPRERLYLTCCAQRRRAGWMERRTPSRFLQGLPLRRAA
jgi:DNA helicase-2/ATP-dependent DNA helicase PcrA